MGRVASGHGLTKQKGQVHAAIEILFTVANGGLTMLSPSQQDQIVQLAKNLSRQKQKAKTMTRSGFMSSKQKSATEQRAEDKLREYLKEL